VTSHEVFFSPIAIETTYAADTLLDGMEAKFTGSPGPPPLCQKSVRIYIYINGRQFAYHNVQAKSPEVTGVEFAYVILLSGAKAEGYVSEGGKKKG
jgi:hypothetical protein